MSTDNSANNKRIAKNTLLLYARMLLLMLISLYTSRVILNSLGVDDYGVYNVVGGLVTMFSILSGSLSSAISRFLTYELGTGNIDKLKKVFSSSVTIQAGLALIIIIVAETIGLWFLNAKMAIPNGRLIAANWCFQFSVLTFTFNLLTIPYIASIIAHERMSAFAYISLLEAIGKLVVAWCISINPIDRLVFYGLMVAVIAWTICGLYVHFCKTHFVECKYHFCYDHNLLRKMFSFAGWSFFGSGSWQLMTQGVNLLLNVYFGVVVNAARGIAMQVDTAVMQFVNNFTTAINPQITKSYAINEKDYMFQLMFKGAKFSYFLVLFFAVPLLCETRTILSLWLKVVPDYTVVFVRLALVASMIHVISNTMVTAMLATGDIKKYQIIVGGLGMMVFPLAWICFYLGLPPEMAYISNIFIFILQFVCRLFLMKQMIGMSIRIFWMEVVNKILITTFVSFTGPLLICVFFEPSLLRLLLSCATSIIIALLAILAIGLKTSERQFVIQQAHTIIKRIYNIS